MGEPYEPDAVYDVNGNGESDISWSVVTGRYRPPRTSQQKSTQDQAVRPINGQRKSKKYGTRQSDDNWIKAGVDSVIKSVVQIDNLDANCRPVSLTDYNVGK